MGSGSVAEMLLRRNKIGEVHLVGLGIDDMRSLAIDLVITISTLHEFAECLFDSSPSVAEKLANGLTIDVIISCNPTHKMNPKIATLLAELRDEELGERGRQFATALDKLIRR